jgi:hypothetical protein
LERFDVQERAVQIERNEGYSHFGYGTS